MSQPERSDPLRAGYERASAVDYYARQTGLDAAEEKLFEAYVPTGSRILDLGVGAGRTTPYLRSKASEYVGLDYSEPMVASCQTRFPGVRFVKGDAADLSAFADASFDVVVFSFNGIDTLPRDEQRLKCLRECRRVLAKGGVFLFSAHNARYVLFRPVLEGVGPLKFVWRLIYAAAHTLALSALSLLNPAFWRGSGYLMDFMDPVHGGVRLHAATPAQVQGELASVGFAAVETVSGNFPRHSCSLATPWYHYAFRKEAGSL